MNLRRLDDRWLPRAAAALAAGLRAWDRATAPARRARAGYPQVRARVLARARLAGFADLRTGPTPLLAVALVLVLLVDVLAAATYTSPPRAAGFGACAGEAPAAPGYAAVGPTPDQPVAAYLSVAACRLNQLLDTAPTASTEAVVDLTGYRSVGQVAGLLGLVTVLRVYFHVRGTSVPYHDVPVTGSLSATLRRALPTTASEDRLEATLLRSFVGRLGSMPAARRYVALYEQVARGYDREAQVLASTSCACVFAVVVRAEGEVLHRLARTTGVRLVDPAPAGVAAGVAVFTPLLPEVTGRVRPPYAAPA